MSARQQPVTRAHQPRALIVSIYGLYAREADGWISVASIIRLMSELGVDEAAVRSSISRLKRREILGAERVGGVAGYALSEQARTIMDEGDRRIFQRRRATLAEGWVLAVFSVPEAERDKRHLLRSRLSWLGFGTVSAGVWVAPAHLLEETRQVLARHELTAYVELFRAEHLGEGAARSGGGPAEQRRDPELAAQVRQWWDLDRLQQLYQQFLTIHGPVRTAVRRRRTTDEGQAFREYLAALTDWRRLPYSDPGLPAGLLPRNWQGSRAEDTFFELRDRLQHPAHAFVTDVRTEAPFR